MRNLFFIFVCVFMGLSASAELSLYPLFCDNAVLQRDVPLKIWGQGDEGCIVKVSFAGQFFETSVVNGQWSVTLRSIPVGGPFSLEVQSGEQKILRSGILMGDVWLCGGQSNMETPVRYYTHQIDRSDEKWAFYCKVWSGISDHYSNSDIHFIKVLPTVAAQPANQPVLTTSQWQICDPTSSQELSATAYFFARKLQPDIGVPVGLIVCAVSGTPAQAWVPWNMLDSNTMYKPLLQYYEQQLKTYPARKEKYEQALQEFRRENHLAPDAWVNPYLPGAPQLPYGPEHHQRPAGLFNGMIAPLKGVLLKGVIWYQGENDAQTLQSVKIYQKLFPDLIAQWRASFQSPDLPFLYVQLASYSSQPSHDEIWPAMRAVQANVERTVSHTAMVAAIDGGLEDEIHPPFKKLVGDRLARAALVNFYGKQGPDGGPKFENAQWDGNRVILHFSRIGKGLDAHGVELGLNGKYKLEQGTLYGFEAAGEDGIFIPVIASIQNGTVILQSDKVPSPVAIRYAWKDFPQANLYNLDGFPAAPFSAEKP